ncbi:alpha-1,3-glucan synthase ags1 [Ceratobasidium sp. AG-Ba]|nr:alpha-1,3-glucan synthase ags1 [Ceratobasidium sp. AG-Ba]
MSLDDYCDLVHSVGGPESLAGQKLIMMGEHDNERLKLDWLRDAAHLELEWLMASMDVDSLSLTTQEAPVFQQAGSFYPYPNRSTAISTRNELKVLVDGSEFEMHTCPNFCTMSFGANNQFRLLVFFPRIQEKITDRMYRNFANQKEMSDWYYVILLALHDLEDDIPEEWRHALTKTIEALPLSYRAAEKLCCPKKAPRSFIGYRIEPYIMNLALERARKIIDDKPEYAMYRGYFFHLCGINLKLATQNIHGREDENPLNHVFRLNPFIDWYAQNPNNITVDVGLAVNLDRRMVPEELKRSTLLIRYWALRELMRPAYTQPQQDRYCHSYVISGLRSTPLASHRARSGMSKFQAYHKDMNAQYVRQDRLVGWNFTVAEALGLGHRTTFSDEMEGYRESIELAGCYGTRYEWRLSAWAANRLLLYEPQDILRRLFNAGVIYHIKPQVDLDRGWASVLNRQRALSKRSRLSPEVQLLAAVLAYWLKGLVKRPDDMSSSRAMSNGLMLSSNAKDYGLPSLRIDVLHEDCLRVRHSVDANSFKIIKQNSVIRPGGLRVKSSRALSGDQRQVDSPPTTPACPSRMPAGPLSVSADFVLDMVNVQLPRAIWARFPEDRMSQGSIARNLRKGPLKLRHWSKVVEPLNEPLTVVNKFHTALDKLFPQIGLRPFEQATLGLTIEKSCSLFGVTCQPSRSLRGTPIPKH